VLVLNFVIHIYLAYTEFYLRPKQQVAMHLSNNTQLSTWG